VHFPSGRRAGTVIGPARSRSRTSPTKFVPVDELVAASLIYRDVALAMLKT